MFDFNVKRQKSEKDMLIERKMEEYKNKFGKDYVINITFTGSVLDDINKCLKENKPQTELVLIKDAVY